MTTTSRFDDDRTVEFVGGAWCGKPYTPERHRPMPLELFLPHGGRTYWYRLMVGDGGLRYVHCGTCLSDGATIR